MRRYIGYVEDLDIKANTCKIRVPNLDGFDADTYAQIGMSIMRITSTAIKDLREADIPMHLQGIQVGDIVYCLDSGDANENFQLMGFFGGTR